MRDFEFGRAVLAGATLLRRRPWAILGLALCGTLVSFAGSVLAVVSTHFMIESIGRPATAAAFTLVSGCANILVLLLVLSVITAAIARGGRAKLGGDEARLFVLSQLAFLAIAVAIVAIAVVEVLVSGGGLQDPWRSGVKFATAGLAMAFVLGVASRLWLAGVMTVQESRFRFAASWRLTRGRPWKVFGAFVVTLLIAAAIGGLGSFGLVRAASALGFNDTVNYDPSLTVALVAVLRPMLLLQVFLQGLLLGLAVVVHAAPAAYIHRSLAGDPVADQAAVFD